MVDPLAQFLATESIYKNTSLPAGELSAGGVFSATHSSINAFSEALYYSYGQDAIFNSPFYANAALDAQSLASQLDFILKSYATDLAIFTATIALQTTLNGQAAALNGPSNSTSATTINGYNYTINSIVNGSNGFNGNNSLQTIYTKYVAAAQSINQDSALVPIQAAKVNTDINNYNNWANLWNNAITQLNNAQSQINGSISAYNSQVNTYNTALTTTAGVSSGNPIGIDAQIDQRNKELPSHATGYPAQASNPISTVSGPSLQGPTPLSVTSPWLPQTPIVINYPQYGPRVQSGFTPTVPGLPTIPSLVPQPNAVTKFPTPVNLQNEFSFEFYVNSLPLNLQQQLNRDFFSGQTATEIFNLLVTAIQQGVVKRGSYNAENQELGSSSSTGAGVSASTSAVDLSNPNLKLDLSLSALLNAFLTAPLQASSIQAGDQKNALNQLTIPLVIFGILLLGKAAQVATIQAANVVGDQTLSQIPPNATIADLLFSTQLAGTASGAVGSSEASQGFLDLISALADQLNLPQLNGAAGTQLAGNLVFLILNFVAAKAGIAIKDAKLPVRIFNAANAVARKPPLPTLFKKLTNNNLKALIQVGPINKQFLPGIEKALINAGLSKDQAEQLANQLVSQNITSVDQLNALITSALTASNVTVNGESIAAVQQKLTQFYGLTALQQALTAVNANAAQTLEGQYQSSSQFVSALKQYLGQENAQQILDQVAVAFAGNVLGLEFTPSVEDTIANANISPETAAEPVTTTAAEPVTTTAAVSVTTTAAVSVTTTAAEPVKTSQGIPVSVLPPEGTDITAREGIRSTLVNDFLGNQGLRSTLVNDFLLNLFGFVPGQVPSTNSLFHEHIKALAKNYAQNVDSQTKFEDYVSVVADTSKINTKLDQFVTDKILNPGNAISLWSDIYYAKHVLNFQEMNRFI